MDITPLVPKERLSITAYGAGGFSLNQKRIDGSIFLYAQHVDAWNEEISLASLAKYLDVYAIELLLVGSGAVAKPLSQELRQALKARGIGVEVMDTGAACRTYNVCLAEDRRVAALLVAV